MSRHILTFLAVTAAFLVLVYFSRSNIGGPAPIMTMVVFVLTLWCSTTGGVTKSV